MKRIIAVIMMMAVMVLGITACGSKNDQPQTTQGGPGRPEWGRDHAEACGR